MLTSETGGSLEFLMLNLLQASEEVYDESIHTDDKMKEDIDTLYKAGQVCLIFALQTGLFESIYFVVTMQKPSSSCSLLITNTLHSRSSCV